MQRPAFGAVLLLSLRGGETGHSALPRCPRCDIASSTLTTQPGQPVSESGSDTVSSLAGKPRLRLAMLSFELTLQREHPVSASGSDTVSSLGRGVVDRLDTVSAT